MDLVRLGVWNCLLLNQIFSPVRSEHPSQDQLITPPRGCIPEVEHLALTEIMAFGALMETSEGQTRFSSRERSPGVLQLHVYAVPVLSRDAFRHAMSRVCGDIKDDQDD